MATLQHPFEKKLDALAIRAARVCVDNGLHQVEARVVAAFDMGTDMGAAYRSGTVHELATAAMALALRFDDDGVVPVWTFSEAAKFEGEMRRDDHVSFLMRRVLPPPPSKAQLPSGPAPSRLAPVIDRIGESLFGAEWAPDVPETPGRQQDRKTAIPALVLIFTGGDCADQAETEALLQYASYFPVFWQFVGVTEGPVDDSRFAFLRHMDVLVGGLVDGCGFFAPDIALGPEAVFTGLVSEFPDWLELPDVVAMLIPRSLPGPAARVDLAGVFADLEETSDPDEDLEGVWAAESLGRLEREERRAARARAEIEGAQAWPKAGVGNPDTDGSARRGQTRPLAPSHWRLEAVRERPWELPDDVAPPAPLAEKLRGDSLGAPAADDDSPSERLARIRRRREERRD